MAEHDLGLANDLPALISRRRALAVLAGGVGVVALAACGGSDEPDAPKRETAEVPDETAGPFPGDGSNGPNALAESGVVRSDIRSSFAGAAGASRSPAPPSTSGTARTTASTPCARGAAAAENYLRGVQ
jgi:hypothetical protein